MSLILRPALPPAQVPALTLVAGLSVAQGIADLLPQEWQDRILIKWPNDIVIDKRKICGILTEAQLRPDGSVDACIVGIGINVRQTDFPEALREIAGSILTQTGIGVSRSALIASFCQRMEENYEPFVTAHDLSPLIPAYERRLINRHAPVRILDPKGEWTGTAQGIDPNGALLVTAEDGTEHTVTAGEVSVRGLYQYTD
jgi:BirA family biotin operon repressor/biotin-[acetyl-CoA-carboxylase] ligase